MHFILLLTTTAVFFIISGEASNAFSNSAIASGVTANLNNALGGISASSGGVVSTITPSGSSASSGCVVSTFTPTNANATTMSPNTGNHFLYPDPSNRHKSYHFKLTQGSCQPDNYRQSCYLINNQFPGPPIFVNQYDFLEVVVVNNLPVATSFHFHGILQTHTLESDGVPFVTQNLIRPNETYVYRVQIEGQTGTYMYHGHFELDIVWLHGPFIIRDNPAFWTNLGESYKFDIGFEHIFQLESIFHQPLDQLVQEIIEDGNDDPTIASLAINGLSYGMWASSSVGGSGNAPGYEVVQVVPGKKYRFRIINISSGSYFRFKIEGHSMDIIEADGILIDPIVNVTHVEINTGQRYSVLVTMNNAPGNYWISCELMAGIDESGPPNGKAILHYVGASNPTPLRQTLFLEDTPGLEPTEQGWILQRIRPNLKYSDNQVSPFPQRSNHTIFIDMHFRKTDGPPRFLINGQQLKQPKISYIQRVRSGEDISLNDPHVFKIHQGDVVDIIFQNRVDDTGGCDEHPIHLHGHSFWKMLSGQNAVDMNKLPGELHKASFRGDNRAFRDVFTLFPNQNPENSTSGAPCGWAVIRFTADNPGLWLVHCHVTSHMILGKMFTLYEIDHLNPKLINE